MEASGGPIISNAIHCGSWKGCDLQIMAQLTAELGSSPSTDV